MDRLFVRLEAIYTARWRMSAATPGVAKAMKEAWCEAMAGIDTSRVKGALSKLHLATDGWPPTPGQFRAMCLPTAAELGLPDREAAWQQAVGNAKLSHPVVWHVREKIGAWNLKNLPQAATRRKFDNAWTDVVARTAQGEAWGWPAGGDPARQIEDTIRKAGRRGPTPASELALKAIRERWGRAPDAAPGAGTPGNGTETTQGPRKGEGEYHPTPPPQTGRPDAPSGARAGDQEA